MHGNWDDRGPTAAVVQQNCEAFDTLGEFLDDRRTEYC